MISWRTVATDPVCGRLVRMARAAAVVEAGGETHYFCSDRCGLQFSAAHARGHRLASARTAVPDARPAIFSKP